jgi:glyoxylase-like metal-dependent hydrolase (beta-lactamase superfamily II)
MAQEITAGIHRLETDYESCCGFPLWLYLIDSGDSLVLLDAGIASTPESTLVDEFKAMGRAMSELTLVVNSHAHPDHMGGNENIRRMSNARFAGPAEEAVWLEDNDRLIEELWGACHESFELDPSTEAWIRDILGERVRMDQLLRDGDSIAAGGRTLRAITTSGHSPGHLAMYDEQSRIVFTFDDVQGAGTPFRNNDVVLAPLYHSRARYLAGMERLLGLDFDALAPAHGPVLSADEGRALINLSVEWVHTVDSIVDRLLKTRGSVGVVEVAEAINELGNFGGVNLQTATVARAHLEAAVREGRAATRWQSVSSDTA